MSDSPLKRFAPSNRAVSSVKLQPLPATPARLASIDPELKSLVAAMQDRISTLERRLNEVVDKVNAISSL